MATINVKVPDEQKREIEETVKRKHYTTTSEYIREAIRNQLERDSELNPEIVRRIQKHRDGDAETLTTEELREDLGLA